MRKNTTAVRDAALNVNASVASSDLAATLSTRNVGAARAEGMRHLAHARRALLRLHRPEQPGRNRSAGLRNCDSARTWCADVVCGTGGNRDWSEHPAHADAMQVQFLSTHNSAGGHRHVHGVNLGVSTQYHAVGGEDFAPVEALQEAGGRRQALPGAPRPAFAPVRPSGPRLARLRRCDLSGGECVGGGNHSPRGKRRLPALTSGADWLEEDFAGPSERDHDTRRTANGCCATQQVDAGLGTRGHASL
jgi:hypothetical protein